MQINLVRFCKAYPFIIQAGWLLGFLTQSGAL
ncbi:MAG: hypothetical protein ACI884_001700, partial [Ulvibacter sp.]